MRVNGFADVYCVCTHLDSCIMSLQTGLQIDVARLALRQHDIETVLISNLQITVPPGIVHTVMGASGSVKSSLLAAVCGTLAPVFTFEGTVSLNGQRIDARPTEQRRVGILFQDDLLFAHMTVRENLLFAGPAGPWAQGAARGASEAGIGRSGTARLRPRRPGHPVRRPARPCGADDSVSKAKASGKGDSNPPVR